MFVLINSSDWFLDIQIADYLQSRGSNPDEFAVGLHKEFQPIEGHDIGQFPSLGTKQVAEVLAGTM